MHHHLKATTIGREKCTGQRERPWPFVTRPAVVCDKVGRPDVMDGMGLSSVVTHAYAQLVFRKKKETSFFFSRV